MAIEGSWKAFIRLLPCHAIAARPPSAWLKFVGSPSLEELVPPWLIPGSNYVPFLCPFNYKQACITGRKGTQVTSLHEHHNTWKLKKGSEGNVWLGWVARVTPMSAKNGQLRTSKPVRGQSHIISEGGCWLAEAWRGRASASLCEPLCS